MNQRDLTSSLVRDTAVKKEKEKKQTRKIAISARSKDYAIPQGYPNRTINKSAEQDFFNSLMLAAGPLQVL